MTKTVLVVDDDPTQRRLIQAVLERDGFAVAQAENGDGAITHLTRGASADVVLLDLNMPGMGGHDTLKEMRARGFSQPVIVLTAQAGVETVVQAMRAGACDFFVKPASPERITVSIRNALSMGQLKGEVERLKKHVSGKTTFDDLIGASPAMQMVKRLGERAAKSSIPILITGESGVGKEVIARYVHQKSRRAGKPFISVNCAAIPDNLLESELFGHEKGAFTGAVARRIGKFEEANGGTLLLDEISEMDARLQAKLLRAIQEREIDRVGGAKPVKVDIRILATSNRDLAQAVRDGTFREDLLYRLNVVNLRLPPLRERPGDVVALAEFFAKKYAAANGMPDRPLSEAARRRLAGHRWPGNVRELENAVHRAVLLSNGPEVQDDAIRLPDGQPMSGQGDPGARAAQAAYQAAETASRAFVGQTVAAMEQQLILDTLSHCLGNRTHAATILGISIRTLRNKLKEYSEAGVQVPAPQGAGAHAA